MSKIFVNVDCDGVLADFVKGACKAHNQPLTNHKWNFYEDWGITEQQFWDKCSGYQFWSNLQTYDHAQDFLSEIRRLCQQYRADLTITTAPSLDPESISAKLHWLKQQFDIHSSDVILGPKKWVMAHSQSILIDDRPLNIKKYITCGGHGILFPQPWNLDYNGMTDIKNWQDVICATEYVLKSLYS